MNQLKDAKWVAEFFDVPLLRVYELSRKRIIPTVRILRQYRYDPEALMEWAKQGGTEKDAWRGKDDKSEVVVLQRERRPTSPAREDSSRERRRKDRPSGRERWNR